MSLYPFLNTTNAIIPTNGTYSGTPPSTSDASDNARVPWWMLIVVLVVTFFAVCVTRISLQLAINHDRPNLAGLACLCCVLPPDYLARHEQEDAARHADVEVGYVRNPNMEITVEAREEAEVWDATMERARTPVEDWDTRTLAGSTRGQD